MATEPTRPTRDIEDIYRAIVRPVILGGPVDETSSPTLVLLGGQPGAGKSRAGARIAQEHDGHIAVLSGDDLRIFHPDYHHLVTRDPDHAGSVLADATSIWVRNTLEDALQERRSLLLEGTFGDPDVTIATANRFRQAGFHVRIVAVASPRVLSLVTAASRYLRDLKTGVPARFTRLSAHDRGYDGTTRLIDSLDPTTVDRTTVVSRNGHVLFDRPSNPEGHDVAASARDALREGRHPASWGARSTMELLGELKQTTAYAIEANRLSADLADLLTAAHDLALKEVVPNLSIDADSPQARFIRQAVTEQSIALRRAASERPQSPDVATEIQPRLDRSPDL